MTTVSTTRQIAAPLARVFEILSNAEVFSEAVPQILNVEFLSEQKRGVGTRFRETRDMNGKEVQTELEITELVENDRIRMVSDQGGTIWDTLFTVEDAGEYTVMTMTMDCRPYRLLARLLNLVIMGMVRKAVESDMDAVKAYCEGTSGSTVTA